MTWLRLCEALVLLQGGVLACFAAYSAGWVAAWCADPNGLSKEVMGIIATGFGLSNHGSNLVFVEMWEFKVAAKEPS